jgi:hypothetical protein
MDSPSPVQLDQVEMAVGERVERTRIDADVDPGHTFLFWRGVAG